MRRKADDLRRAIEAGAPRTAHRAMHRSRCARRAALTGVTIAGGARASV
jgi:hypothetical protein